MLGSLYGPASISRIVTVDLRAWWSLISYRMSIITLRYYLMIRHSSPFLAINFNATYHDSNKYYINDSWLYVIDEWFLLYHLLYGLHILCCYQRNHIGYPCSDSTGSTISVISSNVFGGRKIYWNIYWTYDISYMTVAQSLIHR
jgi:hypothetical protein